MKRHRLDPISLVLGVVVMALGALALGNQAGRAVSAGPWLWPLGLLLGGALIAFVAWRTGVSGDPTDTAP
jgi:hypothetical protein